MKESYTKVLELLKESAEKIVLVTIPPVLCKADSVQHWKTFEGFNKFILEQHNGMWFRLFCEMKLSLVNFLNTGKQVFVVDFGQHLIGYGGFSGCKEYFEE